MPSIEYVPTIPAPEACRDDVDITADRPRSKDMAVLMNILQQRRLGPKIQALPGTRAD
jgi:hypothetical protein